MTNERRQRILCSVADDSGAYYYNGPLDGVWGPASQAAADRFLADFIGDDVMVDTDDAATPPIGTWWVDIEHFNREEFRCKCGGKYCNGFPHEMQPLVMQILERAREWSGQPIVIVSGLRCEEWNRIQGGVSNSQHMYGEAVDAYFYGKSPAAALAWLQSQPDVRYAYQIDGSNNIHFDINPVGR